MSRQTSSPSLTSTYFLILCFFLIQLNIPRSSFVGAELAIHSCNYTTSDLRALRAQTESMFDHAFDSYIEHAFPLDELLPLSCTGKDTFGGLSLSLIDTLDTFLIFRRYSAFVNACRYLSRHLTFDIDSNVSLFETTIRVLGGLLSSHALLTHNSHLISDSGFDASFWYPDYDNSLLYLAVDLADRLMPAFNTTTGIPFGSINLRHGVRAEESRIASTAGAGSLLLEFGMLTRYTRNPKYYRVAFRAMEALNDRKAWTGLVGNHINIDNGEWVATDSGVGGLIDSYYEYMLKGYLLFGDVRLWNMFTSSYNAIATYIQRKPWFLDADMWSGQTSNVIQSSLSAFFPGLQVMMGQLSHATETTRAHYSAWRKYGSLPEGFDVIKKEPASGRINYPLRPELAEAVFYLHWATNDSAWIGVARNMLQTIETNTRVPCGYAEIKNVVSLEKGDLMPSFLMSETFKYLYLTFNGDTHWLRSGQFVFTTEAHPLPVVEWEEMRDIMRKDLVHTSSSSSPTRKSNSSSLDNGTQQDSDDVVTNAEDKDTNFEFNDDDSSDSDLLSTHTLKCGRRPKWEERLTCGFSMVGTDFPTLDVNRLSPESIAPDVEQQVQSFMRKHGLDALNPGTVFLGSDTAYRVVRIRGQEVLFTKLDESDRLEYLKLDWKLKACRRPTGAHLLQRICF